MDILGLDVEKLAHAAFKIKSDKNVIYIDPFQIETHEGADIILITHEHFDHCSAQDLMKIIKPNTVIIAAEECKSKLSWAQSKISEIRYVVPGQILALGNFTIESVPSYNVNKFKLPGQPFHPKEDKKCGYILTAKNVRLYHAGDTDVIPEMESLKNIDIALLPVSGTYVMTADEAKEAVEIIKPKNAVPMHYGVIVGTKEDAERFHQLAYQKTKVIVL